MTTTIFLVRHAAHDNVGSFLAGRTPGIRLGVEGRAQAERLGQRMGRERFDAVIASPRERTQETASAVALAYGLTVRTDERLDEIDFGDAWSGKTWDALNCDPAWVQWNEQRGTARTAGGESMSEVQARAVAALSDAASLRADGAVVLVTHADIIKAVVCHVLDLPLGHVHRFDISPASITPIVWGDWGARLLWLNETIA
ncbi:histidine phosphatase family protein [Tianweitania populi]|uniref:Phosphoglycerate mutase n=1 Tax=Tianweitania populi TaxID=1607949 RepID=A0A8J3GKX7_9HYPH|nr:histidine phosphatase family protein [Tianweitania populi]GHD16487.1 phosphoglycerate mutase [Tianweitania populi]